MGNITSSQTDAPLPTPVSPFFPTPNPPTRQRTQRRFSQPPNAYARRSIFHPDEDEPDDFDDSPGVLLGWTRTEQGVVIPQIRSIPFASPLDDTIFNSPRLPWVERRSRSPVPSARSIPQMRQFSFDSLRSAVRRELRVVNGSRPTTATSVNGQRMSIILADDDDTSEYEVEYISRQNSFEWRDHGRMSGIEENATDNQGLKRYNSTNDSGYSSMNPDTCSESDESVDPWWWEEAAGYTIPVHEPTAPRQSLRHTASIYTKPLPKLPVDSTPQSYYKAPSTSSSVYSSSTTSSKTATPSTKATTPSDPSPQGIQYLFSERQESAFISTVLRNHPTDEWSEWRDNVTNLLMIPEEDDDSQNTLKSPPRTPVTTPTVQPKEITKSPTRRRSLFNFAKVARIGLSKRKSVVW